MLEQLRAMPRGVRVFLVYGFVMLAFLGVTLPLVVAQAVEAPISFPGILWMLLLAYLIFTITLVLQRKQAGYPLALGLASLSVPIVPLMYLSPAGFWGAVVASVVAILVIWSIRRPASRTWFVEP
jgi:hypothetical protein